MKLILKIWRQQNSNSKGQMKTYKMSNVSPCLEIYNDINNAYKYTNKGNLVAVISNGTACLVF